MKNLFAGKLPMTKFDIRVLTLAMLDIEPGDVFLDIGAGTGSISVQSALLGAEVYAIEREIEGVNLIRQNAEKFGVTVHVVHGSAPEAMADIPVFQRCFIGGSGGHLRSIVEALNARLGSGARIVANFIKPDNMVQLNNLFKTLEYTRLETRLIQAAVADRLGLLRGQNPVFIVKGEKSMKLLYGVGVGPGDPELLTVKAIRVLRDVDYVFVPRPKIEEQGMAETIVAEYLDEHKAVYLHFPMGPDNAELYKQTANRIDAVLHDGECGAFITIGDPMVYSTFTYVMFEAQKRGINVDIIPGISSGHAAAATLQWPLTIKDESFYLADGSVDEEVLRRVQSVCVLKPRKEQAETLKKFEDHGFEYAYVKRCSLPEQEILRDREHILKDGEYMTLLLARKTIDD